MKGATVGRGAETGLPLQGERCVVPGCDGWLEHHPDGMGAVRSWCSECERRIEQVHLLRQGRGLRTSTSPAAPAPSALSDEQLCALATARLLPIKVAAQRAKSHAATLVSACKAGQLRHVRFGMMWFVAAASLEQWIKRPRVRRGRSISKYLEHLPRTARDAKTVKVLARDSGWGRQRWSVWCSQVRPGLKRRAVEENGRAAFAYWFEEGASP